MDRKINTAIIGVGAQGWHHTYKLKNYERSNLLAVCDIKEDLAKKVGEEFGVKYYADYRHMIAKEEGGALSISPPDFLHRDPVVFCLDSGLNVIVQKPFATDLQDAKDMVEAGRRNKGLLVTDYINRWNPVFYTIKEAIKNGEIGEPVLFNFRGINPRWVPLGEKPGSCGWAEKTSLVGWLGSHFIDQTLWLSKAKVEKVYAVARKKILKDLGKNTNDFYQIILELDSGAVSTIRLDWIMPDSLPNWGDLQGEVIGTRGAMKSSLAGQRNIQKFTEDEVKYLDPVTFTNIRGKINTFVTEVVGYFLDCIYEDKEPFITLEDGLECVRVMVAIEKSANEKRPVMMKEIK